MKNFGEFFGDQISVAKTVVFSHTDTASAQKVEEALGLVRSVNPHAVIVATPIAELSGEQLLSAISGAASNDDLQKATEEAFKHEHHHHHHHEGEHDECCHHHHHDGDHGECCHHHEGEHHHHNHHEHDENCTCGCHGHHADEVFTSWGKETTREYSAEDIDAILCAFDEDAEHCGMILRAKGIVKGKEGQWIHFDYVPGEHDIRYGSSAIIGKICVIGASLSEDHISTLFGV